jgi:hypothetical protein
MPISRHALTLGLVALACCASASQEEKTAGSSNRLAAESSPYLLLHAGNPVDWYPWGEEAIERARKEDKPIFLSVGYSTCFWCHVMEREVFSNPEIAALMNQWFVNIKVDREERPDLDEIYMTATQLLTQSGGWPNSVFLTPSLKPFYAGTYFPPEDRAGRMGFPTLLRRLHELWSTRRPEILDQAERVAEALKDFLENRPASRELPSLEIARQAVAELKKSFDSENGGFGGAPKFPSPANLALLWEEAASGDAEARHMVLQTLRQMGRGAIYDQLRGGFHRYTLDDKWRVPHFEKMLYDNAQLAEILARAAASASSEDAVELARLARGTLDFTLAEMTLPGGGFKSAIDAETEGEEGAYYVWTADELREVLGEEGFARLSPVFSWDDPPNFEGGKYTLFLARPLPPDLEPLRDRLRRARAKRPFPRVDDKVLTDWNGMMIAAMARAGKLLAEPGYVKAAARAADFLLQSLRAPEGTLLHAWRLESAKIPAFLDDYAFFIQGLLALEEATGEARWLREAERLTGELEARLGDAPGGYYQSEPRPDLLVRLKTVNDGAIPSANGTMILNLLSLAQRTGKGHYGQRAVDTLRAFAPDFERYPGGPRTLALATLRYYRTQTPEPAPAAGRQAPARKSLSALGLSLVEARASLETPELADGWQSFRLTLSIGEGWHINANPASDAYQVATAVDADPPSAGALRNLRYPEGERVRFSFADRELAVYRHRVLITGEAGPGVGSLLLTYQACDDLRCLPAVELRVPLRGQTK